MKRDWQYFPELADEPWLTADTRALRDELNAKREDVLIARRRADEAMEAAAAKGIDDLDVTDFDARSLYRGASFTACRAERDLRQRIQTEYRPLWLADRHAAHAEAEAAIGPATKALRAGLAKLGWVDTDDAQVPGYILPIFLANNPTLRRLRAAAHDLAVAAEPAPRNGAAIKALQQHLEQEHASLIAR